MQVDGYLYAGVFGKVALYRIHRALVCPVKGGGVVDGGIVDDGVAGFFKSLFQFFSYSTYGF